MDATSATWRPAFGAWPEAGGTRFRVWAPVARDVEVQMEPAHRGAACRRLVSLGDGTWGGWFADIGAGDRYRYRLDGGSPLPDPASRHQPDGVHGPSSVVDPGRYAWRHHAPLLPGIPRGVIYELHVGTFSPEGTFDGLRARLPQLAALGIAAIELMPVADFPGRRNWGYDGVALYAPARCYGTPDDLRRLVDEAHGHGLAVLLDVVYNHFGPDGAYHALFSPYYHGDGESPWGRAVNLDGPHAGFVRAFFVDNALHWLAEYRLDGLRLDATHALVDRSRVPLPAELAAEARRGCGRRILVIAEDERNFAAIVMPVAAGGWGLDAVWTDDFHHQLQRLLTGDAGGWYRDFAGTTPDLAETIRRGWFFRGQRSAWQGGPRGTDPAGLSKARMVVSLQNHDQVGNRPLGDRLHHRIDLPTWRAASALLLVVPETPLLFMGQEWAATTPFLYFTDHPEPLGRLVAQGRREDLEASGARASRAVASPPEPQAEATFFASRLRWEEASREPHASVLRLYEALIALRSREPAFKGSDEGAFSVEAVDDGSLAVDRRGPGGTRVAALVRLRGAGPVALPPGWGCAGRWRVLLTTEAPEFAPDARPPAVDLSGAAATAIFDRPGAVIVAGTPD